MQLSPLGAQEVLRLCKRTFRTTRRNRAVAALGSEIDTIPKPDGLGRTLKKDRCERHSNKAEHHPTMIEYCSNDCWILRSASRLAARHLPEFRAEPTQSHQSVVPEVAVGINAQIGARLPSFRLTNAVYNLVTEASLA
jgi:hypothetical protein